MEILEPAAVESHISRKTSEIWGTQASFPLSLSKTFPLTEHGILHLAKHKRDMRYTSFVSPLAFKNFSCNRTWVPHISLVFREMWDSTNLSRATLS
ncbi:MAG: hypothetical protein QOJ42_6709 [Acidobacteriaceae bacterium]|nr:hypothetical protein [Acidobacteriaceae bacterium]